MKHLSLVLFGLLFLLSSCADPCKERVCNNGGTCFEGDCNCRPAWTGPNCDTPKCDEIDCQNGDCENGECNCDPGYYGTLCERRMDLQFTGAWSGSQTCVETGGGTSNASQSLSISEKDWSSYLDLEISSIVGYGGPVQAFVENERTFTIPYQSRSGKAISGGGTLTGDRLEIDYAFNDGVHHDCTLVLER